MPQKCKVVHILISVGKYELSSIWGCGSTQHSLRDSIRHLLACLFGRKLLCAVQSSRQKSSFLPVSPLVHNRVPKYRSNDLYFRSVWRRYFPPYLNKPAHMCCKYIEKHEYKQKLGKSFHTFIRIYIIRWCNIIRMLLSHQL